MDVIILILIFMQVCNLNREDEISLTRRLGNVNNELSVFVMNKTTEMLQVRL